MGDVLVKWLIVIALLVLAAIFAVRGNYLEQIWPKTPVPEAPAEVVAHGTMACLGEEVKQDDLGVTVALLDTTPISNHDVALIAVLGSLENTGAKPMNAPAVAASLYDTDKHAYAPIRTQGDYAPGASLEPLAAVDEEWAFVTPKKAQVDHIEFLLLSGKIIQIDAKRKLPIPEKLIAMDRRTTLEAKFEDFRAGLETEQTALPPSEQAAIPPPPIPAPQTADVTPLAQAAPPENPASAPVAPAGKSKALLAAEAELESVIRECDDVHAKWAAADKKIKTLTTAFTRANEERNRDQTATQKARDNVRASGSTRAQDELARCEKREANSNAVMLEKQAAMNDYITSVHPLKIQVKVSDSHLVYIKEEVRKLSK